MQDKVIINESGPEFHLHNLANFFAKKNAQYGDAYKKSGEIMAMIMNRTFDPKTPADYRAVGILYHIINKVIRIGASGIEHRDSAADLCVYAAMLLETMNDAEEERNKDGAPSRSGDDRPAPAGRSELKPSTEDYRGGVRLDERFVRGG